MVRFLRTICLKLENESFLQKNPKYFNLSLCIQQLLKFIKVHQEWTQKGLKEPIHPTELQFGFYTITEKDIGRKMLFIEPVYTQRKPKVTKEITH